MGQSSQIHQNHFYQLVNFFVLISTLESPVGCLSLGLAVPREGSLRQGTRVCLLIKTRLCFIMNWKHPVFLPQNRVSSCSYRSSGDHTDGANIQLTWSESEAVGSLKGLFELNGHPRFVMYMNMNERILRSCCTSITGFPAPLQDCLQDGNCILAGSCF